jgi:lipid-A-disaccharide synthase-like uncharacterized protein
MSWNDFSVWLVVGLVGQAAFFSRFLVQWIASERMGRSTVPTSFWYLSLTGSALLLGYAIHRQDPVFILGQSVGSVVYVRNLVLLSREPQAGDLG